MDKLLGKYPDRVPVMVQSKIEGDAETKVLKYMVPRDRTIAQMIVQLRKHIKMTPKQAVYLFAPAPIILSFSMFLMGTSCFFIKFNSFFYS